MLHFVNRQRRAGRSRPGQPGLCHFEGLLFELLVIRAAPEAVPRPGSNARPARRTLLRAAPDRLPPWGASRRERTARVPDGAAPWARGARGAEATSPTARLPEMRPVPR